LNEDFSVVPPLKFEKLILFLSQCSNWTTFMSEVGIHVSYRF
jgi:hypothetical protein